MGEARHWILLRGLVRGRGHWGDFPEKFQQKFPQDSFELIDLPGNGESRRELSPLHISEYVQIIRSRSQFLRDGKKLHLLAVSLGGMIAAQWVKEYPEEVCKAYLVCTSAGNVAHFYERLRPKNYLKILQLILPHTPEDYETEVLKIIANNAQRIQALRPQFQKYSERYPVSRKNFVRQVLAAARSEFPAEAPGDITLIGSYGDQLVSPACTLKMARLWKLQPRMHPSAGHDIPIDDPDWLLEQLE